MTRENAETTSPVVRKVQNSFRDDDELMSLEKRRAISVGIGDRTQKRTTKNGYQLLLERRKES